MSWEPEQLDRIERADELRVAARRDDGSLSGALPVWVVRVGDDVFVRTWHRRETGWFGRAVRTGRARISVPGVEADVAVQDVGAVRRAEVDEAYRGKYGRYGRSTVDTMVGEAAAASTLRLVPEQRLRPPGPTPSPGRRWRPR